MLDDQPNAPLDEVLRETTMGGVGIEVERPLPVIDFTDFDARREEITNELWDAATASGFFQIINHGLSVDEIEQAFALTEAFFALPKADKAKLPLLPGSNAGWESRSQVRPSTGTNDEKESYQITRHRMDALWPDESQLAVFRETLLEFEAANWRIAMQILSCFATSLGFGEDFFTELHDPASTDYQSTLRLLHYHPTEPGGAEENRWRAGAHTDWDCVSLLHQRDGEHGLQLCPGADMASQRWTSVEARTGVITCNIGDMLMRWSDDRLPSTLHRVRIPDDDAARRPRYSMAFFAQANRDAVIESPSGTRPAITAGDFIQQRIASNFSS